MPKISGKHLSELHLEALTNIINKNTNNHPDNRPMLAFFLVGDRDDSRIYVDIKKKMCDKIGITYKEYHLPEVVGVNELAKKIDICNRDPLVHGIIIQLPLPDHLPEESLLQLVDPDKDVDGFHSLNIARLVSNQIIDYDEEGKGEGDDGKGNGVDEGESVGNEKIITLVDHNYSYSRDTEIGVIQKNIVQQHHAQKGF